MDLKLYITLKMHIYKGHSIAISCGVFFCLVGIMRSYGHYILMTVNDINKILISFVSIYTIYSYKAGD